MHTGTKGFGTFHFDLSFFQKYLRSELLDPFQSDSEVSMCAPFIQYPLNHPSIIIDFTLSKAKNDVSLKNTKHESQHLSNRYPLLCYYITVSSR
ncbi:hypothetical protein EYC80_001683 [Monilinia laxa]|uniref:Uncharacterized protein n=1 Tax=Monilinia laxa TaxID=61186 RepID=A0A5N6K6G4_MONLA|nr:hypothetical protein EYC80_001683 [Monilinia laxa]